MIVRFVLPHLICTFLFFTMGNGLSKVEPIDCLYIKGDVHLEDLITSCGNYLGVIGDGYIILDTASESTIHNFFLEKIDIKMSLKLTMNKKNPSVVNLGKVASLGSGDPSRLALWVENTFVRDIVAPYLKNVSGIRVLGNRYLSKEALSVFEKTTDPRSYEDEDLERMIKYRRIQKYGECNFDMSMPPNFTSCATVNNLILPVEQVIPDFFQPESVAGCVFIQNTVANHDYLRKVALDDPFTFECGEYNMKLFQSEQIITAIIRNPSLCIKDSQVDLAMSQVNVVGNGNPECGFECTSDDILTYSQRYCVELKGDLELNDDIAVSSRDIQDLTKYLTRIDGGIRIYNLSLVQNQTLDMRALEFITNGGDEQDIIISIYNSTLKTILFENLTSMIGGEYSVVTNGTPNFELSKDEKFLISIASNNRPISIETEEIEKQKAEEKRAIEEEEEKQESENNQKIIAGSVSGGVALFLVIVAVVIVVLVVVKRKKNNSKKKMGKDKLSPEKKNNPNKNDYSRLSTFGETVASAKKEKISRMNKTTHSLSKGNETTVTNIKGPGSSVVAVTNEEYENMGPDESQTATNAPLLSARTQ